jgi:hypothetical protein
MAPIILAVDRRNRRHAQLHAAIAVVYYNFYSVPE